MPAYIEKWTRPMNYIGEDFSHYYRIVGIISDGRDSLEASNFTETLRRLREIAQDRPEVIREVWFGSWLGGDVGQIFIHESASLLLLEKAAEICAEYNDYPVLNEQWDD